MIKNNDIIKTEDGEIFYFPKFNEDVRNMISNIFSPRVNSASRSIMELASKLPYNYSIKKIRKDKDTPWTVQHILEIPVAGYEKNEIKVNFKNNILTVSFEPKEEVFEETPNEENIAIKTGITHSSFKMQWAIKNITPDCVESCRINKGILTIKINEKTPIDDSTEIPIA